MEPRGTNGLNRPPSALKAAALECLERGGTVVTGNARAARSLRRLYSEAQRAAGKLAWSTPLILDWTSWLDVLWKQHLQNAHDAPLLLTPLQERAVWKRLTGQPGMDADALATLAAQAWALLSEFDSQGERNRSWSGVREAEVFRGWALHFDRECRANRWIARADLSTLLTESMREGTIEPPSDLLLVGFDPLPPARRRLLEAARSAGAMVNILDAPAPAEHRRLVQAGDPQDELETCAWWLRRTLEADPACSIAVVVDGVEEKRGEIERTFRPILMPEAVGIEANEAMPFEFSLGVTLATVPIVKAALLVLRWVVEPLEYGAVSWLMTSGYLSGPGDDAVDMAMLDAEMRKHGKVQPELTLEACTEYRVRRDTDAARDFLARIRGLLRTARSEGAGERKKTFAEWMDSAEALLKQVRWPGSNTLSSVEYQALARWERLLAECAKLSFDGSRVGWSEFVTVLERYAGETIFSAESRDAPVQIMGAFESSGQEFKALWCFGVDDRSWPPAGQPSPLLPLWLQQKVAMPHASLEAEWTLGLALTRRLAGSAAQCVFSYSLRDESGELRASALLAEAFGSALRAVPSNRLRAGLHAAQHRPNRCLTEWEEDSDWVPWPRGQHAGGAEILKHQAACGFRAFAVRRLGAEKLETVERGLSPRDRGSIVHAVLQALWSQDNPGRVPLKTRDDLLNARASGKLPEVLRHHIAEVFRTRTKAATDPWFRSYLHIEQERLFSVLSQWLEIESGRQPFTVEVHEQEVAIALNGLDLKVRVDRIDRVDGGRLILDYKTGLVQPTMWDGPRPDDPQLPLYGVHGPVDDLRGLLFAQIRTGQMDLKGRAQNVTSTVSNKMSGNKQLMQDPLNEERLGQWADALSSLADQFLAGEAAVAPKRYPKTCTHCGLQPLCRVAEKELTAQSELGDEEAESAFSGTLNFEEFADD